MDINDIYYCEMIWENGEYNLFIESTLFCIENIFNNH